MKVVLQHVLVKKLQVFYRNGLLKHPKKKVLLMKPCIERIFFLKKAAVTWIGRANRSCFSVSAGVTAAELPGNLAENKCQTHSLSMEKQVTGPSAAQVAVLSTSLREESH